jgi:hypothetical protein
MDALKRRCPVCKQKAGQPCVTITRPVKTLLEAFGAYEFHSIRADGLPYNKEEREG